MNADHKREAEWKRALDLWAGVQVTSKTIADPYFIGSGDGRVTPVAGDDLRESFRSEKE